MQIVFDPNKSQRNEILRNLPFDLMRQFDWQTAVIWQDTRINYPEPRFIALGLIGERVYAACFTPTPQGTRIISFRKANKREIKKYENQRHTII
ncbi:hypothetical protein A4G20_08045 [Pasteurellaceae bacterium RH1A]|nr:hypothetical protein A4G20_08045 [Pasteurellaceae bacterium RH1A]